MNSFKSSTELKSMAKEKLFGHYGTVVGVTLIICLISASINAFTLLFLDTSSLIGLIIFYFVTLIISTLMGLFLSGKAYLYLKLTCEQPISVGDLFQGFVLYPNRTLSISFVLSIISFVASIPMLLLSNIMTKNNDLSFILPFSFAWLLYMVIVIISNLLFSQVYYLLHDFPEHSAHTILIMSIQTMKAHKGRLFYLWLSFIPLYLLGLFSCCIAFLWIVPYMDTTLAHFYMDLMHNRSQT